MANEPTTTSEIVLIGCKLPHGLYLDIRDKAGNVSQRFKLKGVSGFTLPNPDRKFQNPETFAGHTINQVPRKLWEEWLATHKDHPAMLSGAIFFSKNRDAAEGQAKEREKENVGFDKIDPTDPAHRVKKLDDSPAPK